jgi:hypothetical protein
VISGHDLPTFGGARSGREIVEVLGRTIVGRSIVGRARSAARRVVVGVVVGAGLASGATVTVASAAPVQERAVADVALDVADLGKFAALKYCATKSFAADPDSVRVLYGVRQLTGLTTSSRTFVLRNGAGKVLLCDLFGRDRPSILPLPTTSAERPAVHFSNGQRRWSCDGTTLRSFRMTSWLKVQDPVRSARIRYTTNGVPGPWFTAARQGRFIHLQSWLGSALATDVLKVELQLLDRFGAPVTVQGIPSGPRKLEGCGTNVMIG